MTDDWAEALGGVLPSDAALRVCYYSHLLHRGTAQSPDDPETLDDDEQDMLIMVGDLLTERISGGPVPIAQGTRTVRARAAAEMITRRFGPQARVLAMAFCREVNCYQSKPRRRARTQETLAAAVAEHRPRVLIAHSLGSVIAYETLWSRPDLHVDLLITLGSPLGMPTVVFDRLKPSPEGGRGSRPPGVRRWVNLADIGDFVAVPPTLALKFDGIGHDAEVVVGEWAAHGARHYLANDDVREAILHGLP
ncbi:hypothetical protein ACH34Q_22230 [Actinomadura sp. 9N407]